MPKEIQVPDAPFSEQNINLSGISMTMKFYWNEAAKFWSLSISVKDVPIINGFGIMTNSCISSSWGYKLQTINNSFGAIYCINTDNTDTPLTRFSFGKTALLIYYTAEEIAALSVAS